jgi:hypothetical protein
MLGEGKTRASLSVHLILFHGHVTWPWVIHQQRLFRYVCAFTVVHILSYYMRVRSLQLQINRGDRKSVFLRSCYIYGDVRLG